MRRGVLAELWVLALLVPVLVAGAGESGKKALELDDGIDVFFRDVDLSVASDQPLEVYPEAEPGEAGKLERAFEGAPPQIPHTVAEMEGIGVDVNECLDCHHPENAIGKEDVPIPKSHFERAVLGEGAAGQGMVWVVKGYKEGDELPGSRHNCTMCHAPQATNVQTPRSTFNGK